MEHTGGNVLVLFFDATFDGIAMDTLLLNDACNFWSDEYSQLSLELDVIIEYYSSSN